MRLWQVAMKPTSESRFVRVTFQVMAENAESAIKTCLALIAWELVSVKPSDWKPVGLERSV